MPTYFAYGLRIVSDVPVPGLDAGSDFPNSDESASVAVCLGSLPAGLDHGGRVAFPGSLDEDLTQLTVEVLPGGDFLLRYRDGTRFVVDRLGTRLWALWAPELTVEDTATYLLGPVLAFVLRLRGTLSLHAGVVALAGGAVAISGAPGSGKSTLTAAFALRGASVLGDDVAPLSERGGVVYVLPTSPRVRLWPDSVIHLLGSASALPALTPNWDKCFLDLAERRLYQSRAMPLQAVFLLDERVETDAAPSARRMGALEAFESILAQLHTVWMFPQLPQAPVFALATRLVETTPVFRLTPHRDPARLDALCATVESEVARLGVRRRTDPAAAPRATGEARDV